MKVSKNIQGSPEWKKERYGRIGGTGLKDLMANKEIQDLALFYNILGDLSEDYIEEEDPFTSRDMERGTEREPDAVRDAGEYLSLTFESFGCCTIDELPLHHLSPDGFTADLRDGIEIKSPGRSTHAKYIVNNEIPPEYFWQCIAYFLINEKLERLHFVSYRPENKHTPMFLKTIERDTPILFKLGKEYSLTPGEWADLAKDKCEEFEEEINKQLENQSF